MSRYGGSRAKTGSEAAPVPCFQAKKDPFNISNDEYYNPKHISNSQGLSGFDGNVVQHSIPALDLHSPWFPTQLSSSALRHFHRPKLRIRCPRGEQSTGWYSVSSLESYIASKAREREKERANSGGGEVFFMRSPEDLSICDGHLVLAECSEQYPPLLSAIGLATKMKNYYRRSEVPSISPTLNVSSLNVSSLNVSSLNVSSLNVSSLNVSSLNISPLNISLNISLSMWMTFV